MANKEYTEEELNYFRVCYITTHIIREGLKELFKREWNRHYSPRFGLWQDTAKNGQDFFRMESKKSRSKKFKTLDYHSKWKHRRMGLIPVSGFRGTISDNLHGRTSMTIPLNKFFI